MIRTALVAFVAGCVGWSHADTIREAAFAAGQGADYAQTRSITARCVENNPLIGRCGERIPLAPYFAGSAIVHLGVSAALPPSWRYAWQLVTLGVEGATLSNNAATLSHW